MSIWDYSEGPSWKRSRKFQRNSTDLSGIGGNTRTFGRRGSSDRRRGENNQPYVCVVIIPNDVRGKETSPESMLSMLRRANRRLPMQALKILCCEESGPGHTWKFSIEKASMKFLEAIDPKPNFNFGKGQLRLEASEAEGSGKLSDQPKPSNPRDETPVV
ncbi:hypothetical protein JTB14_020853 [Gonioctena quinquepunctata]|nr:hypothetical protein JTB14_020853 [Gonioctena quinquepunctata]